MAFTAIDTTETRKVISVLDPAINLEKSDLVAYRLNYDESFLTLHEDVEPTVFELRHLPHREANKIKDMFTKFSVPTGTDDPNDRAETSVSMNTAYSEACRWGVVGWTGVRDKDGNEVKTKTHRRSSGSKSLEVLSDDSLAQLNAWGVAGELGRLLISLTDLDEDERKN